MEGQGKQQEEKDVGSESEMKEGGGEQPSAKRAKTGEEDDDDDDEQQQQQQQAQAPRRCLWREFLDGTLCDGKMGGGMPVVDRILAHVGIYHRRQYAQTNYGRTLLRPTLGSTSRALSTRSTAADVQAALIRSFCISGRGQLSSFPGRTILRSGPEVLLQSAALAPGAKVVPGRCSLFRYKLAGDPLAPVPCRSDRDLVLQCAAVDGMDTLEFAPDFRGDKEVVLAAVAQNGCALAYVSPELKDRNVVLVAVKQNGCAFQYADDQFKNDRDIALVALTEYGLQLSEVGAELQDNFDVVLAAVRSANQEPSQGPRGHAYPFASERLRANREVLLAAIAEPGSLVTCDEDFTDDRRRDDPAQNALSGIMPDEFWSDREVVIALVKRSGYALEFASVALRGDAEVVELAIRKSSTAYEYASEELRKRRDLALLAVQGKGFMLRHVPASLRGDRAVVLAAVQQTGNALQFAPWLLKADRALVIAAIQQDGRALQYASEALQGDKDLVLVAVQQRGEALKYASPNMKANYEVALAAVKQSWNAFPHVSPQFRGDRELALAALVDDSGSWRRNWDRGNLLPQVPHGLWCDRDFVLPLVRLDWRLLEKASAALRSDRQVALLAAKQNLQALDFVNTGSSFNESTNNLFADRAFMLELVKMNGCLLQKAAPFLRCDEGIILEAVAQDYRSLPYAYSTATTNKALMLKAVKLSGKTLQYASEALKADRELVLEAVKQDGAALQFAAEALRGDVEVVVAASKQDPAAVEHARLKHITDLQLVAWCVSLD